MKVRSLFVGALALALPFAATACGDDGDDTNSGTRPSAAEIATGLKKIDERIATLGDEYVDCIATELEKSDLPNGVLQAAAEGREPKVKEGNEDDYTEIITTASTSCASSLSPSAGG